MYIASSISESVARRVWTVFLSHNQSSQREFTEKEMILVSSARADWPVAVRQSNIGDKNVLYVNGSIES